MKDQIVLLFRHDSWANKRLLDAAKRARIGSKSPSGEAKIALQKLSHVLGLEDVYLKRCFGESPTSILTEEDFSDLAALQECWLEHETRLDRFLAGLDEDALNAVVKYRRMRDGVEYQHPLSHLLLHMVLHSQQTRAEAGVALTNLGCSPGDIDFIVYLREMDNAGPEGVKWPQDLMPVTGRPA